jgi:cytochrome P450
MKVQAASRPTVHKGIPVLWAIRKHPTLFFTKLMLEEGDYAWLNVGGRDMLMLNDATGIEYVLQKNSKNYCKGYFHNFLKPLFGNSMFLNEGAVWREGRERAAPVFANGNFDEIVRQMALAAETMFERWDKLSERGEPVDMTIEMTRFALDALLRALFHSSKDEVAVEMRTSLGVILKDVESRFWSVISLPKVIAYNLPKYRNAQKFLRALVTGLIEKRKQDLAYPEDLLSRLVNDFGFTADEEKLLYDEVLSFVLAGHDTTAHGLAWSLYTIGRYPEILKRIRAELLDVLGDREPTLTDIKSLSYVGQVFSEVMRLYPPVWTMSREAIDEDKIPFDEGGTLRVSPGTTIMMCHYAVHRREKYWRNPEAFDPERFRPEAVAARPKFAWFPFGGGPRVCLGQRFAQVEAILALAMMFQRYEMTLLPGQEVKPEPIITLRPDSPILFKLRKLESNGRAPIHAGASGGARATASAGSRDVCPFH